MLYNKTTKQEIIAKTRIAKGFFSQLKGLMFEKQKNFDYALVFPLPFESSLGASIHTLFVFFPIDVVFLDRQKKAIEIAIAVKPFTPLYAPKKNAAFFIELPAGKAKNIKPGHVLEWH